MEERICTMNEVVSPECQTASTSGKKSTGLQFENHQATSSYRNHRKQANDMIRAKKGGLQKASK